MTSLIRELQVAGHTKPSLPQGPTRKPLYISLPLTYTSPAGEEIMMIIVAILYTVPMLEAR